MHVTNECQVHLSGLVNKQNFRYWEAHNPENEQVNESPRSVLKVTAWVAIGWDGIIGPYFFENDDGKTVTVDQINHRRMLEKFYLPELRRKARIRDNRILIRTQWFQQGGAHDTRQEPREESYQSTLMDV